MHIPRTSGSDHATTARVTQRQYILPDVHRRCRQLSLSELSELSEFCFPRRAPQAEQSSRSASQRVGRPPRDFDNVRMGRANQVEETCCTPSTNRQWTASWGFLSVGLLLILLFTFPRLPHQDNPGRRPSPALHYLQSMPSTDDTLSLPAAADMPPPLVALVRDPLGEGLKKIKPLWRENQKSWKSKI